MQNHFTIIIDACEQEEWIERCIKSCINQNYNNFEILLVDAISTDRTFEISKEFENKYNNFSCYQNEIRVPQIANILSLTEHSKDNTIIVSVDGDDWLKDNDVLNKLNIIYNSGDVLITYGSFEEYPSGQKCGWIHEYPKLIVNNNLFRSYPWVGSHLRTYKKELFMKINIEDFKREDGEWLDTTGDMAFMIPMLEMAGDRSRFVSEILYVYNSGYSNSDSNRNRNRQIELENYIRSKKKYLPI